MRIVRREPKIYRHAQLMHDLNELHVRIKVHLFQLGDEEYRRGHPKPSAAEMDAVLNQIMTVLRRMVGKLPEKIGEKIFWSFSI